MSKFTITEPLVRKLLGVVDAGLVRGVGVPEPGKMCVEAAISYALGEPHSDGPSCVDPIVRQVKITLNDSRWSSDIARARGMRRVAIAQLGSKNVIDSVKFVTLLSEYVIREIVPIAIRSYATLNPMRAHDLEQAAVRCEHEGTAAASDAASSAAAASSAYDAAYAAYAASAASSAAYAASSASVYAASAASSAAAASSAYDAASAASSAAAYAASSAYDAAYASSAYDAAYAAYAASAASSDAYDAYAAAASSSDAYAAAYAAAASDNVLSICASLMVRALQECGSPGCDWLWLVDETEVNT